MSLTAPSFDDDLVTDLAKATSSRFTAEVRARFGVLPNFFCTAASAPGLIEQLWGFAKSSYLDNPLPSLFKERLFVQLSRFCEIRYCIIRHVGFLVGEGRPAGDANVAPQSVEQAMALLRRPIPNSKQLEQSLAQLEGVKSAISIPEAESELEGALFDALTILFISPQGADRARSAVLHAVGEPTFELLIAYLAFVRTAHYWTETHPVLGIESDMVALMKSHPDLASLLLNTQDADWANSAQALRRALEELRSTAGALLVSEERYRMLVTTSHDILYRMNWDWSEMWTLDGRKQLADTTSLDTNWIERYIPEDERERVTAAIQKAVASKGPFELEHRVLRADGSRGWVLSRAIPVIDEQGGITEWFGTAIDLTARKTAEEALQRSYERLERVVQTEAVGVMFWNTETGVLLDANAAFLKMMGYERGDITDGQLTWEKLTPPECYELSRAEMQQFATTGRIGPYEKEYLRKDGSRLWLLFSGNAVGNNEAVEFCVDITGRKTAEEALHNADRRKDEFLATLAHELRNPLAPLRNGLQIARLQGAYDSPIARTIDMMDRQVNMLAHLVDDLLDVSRITSGKIQLRGENVNLRAALAASAEASRSVVDAHRHRLLIRPCAEDMTVYGDFDRLTQVFSNLLSNAAKYTRDGGTIELQVGREGGEAVVTVTDSGIGIPAESLSNIFDMFSQVRTHQDYAAGGLGIGLSLVRPLVEMHGGSVSASSPGPNEGSTFTVRLPLVGRTEKAVVAPGSADVQTNGKQVRRVLIVDDNRDAANSLTEILKQWGHLVATAFNGEEGVAKAAIFQPDIALLDLGMPGMDGFEAATRIRALPGAVQMTLIALTGWGQEQDRERTRLAGFDRHLLKPIDFDALRILLAEKSDRSMASVHQLN